MTPPRKNKNKNKKRKKNSLPSSSRRRRRPSTPPTPPPPPPKPLVPYIPDDVIFFRILPFLSFHNLVKLKRVCKSWYSSISSSFYSGVIFPECNSNGHLVFLPTTTSCGAGPSDFLSVSFSQQPCKELIASTDGLLCLDCNTYDNFIYVCNPLTKEGHVIPLNQNSEAYVWRSSIGLAYDSLKSPAQYKLVRPWSYVEKEKEMAVVFGFEIFSSHTNMWDKSCNKYYIQDQDMDVFDPPPPTAKTTYAGGVLYWDCIFLLIHFDPEKGHGGTLRLPFDPMEQEINHHQIGESKGRLTCSRVSPHRGMQVWILQDGSTGRWELIRRVCFTTVIENNRYILRSALSLCFGMPIRNRKDMKNMFEDFDVVVLPYGDDNGGRLFMRVQTRKEEDNALCLDANSGKLNKICTLPATYCYEIENRHSFLYRGNMVSLPKLGN